MTEKLIFKGVWFLPDNPTRQVYGTLTYDANESSYLDLLGTFVDKQSSKERHEPDFIFGKTTENKTITLFKTFQSSYSLFASVETSKYVVNFVFDGDHFENNESLCFDTVKGKFDNLNDWISEFGIKKFDPDYKNHKLSVDYELPHSIDFKINDELKGKLNFSFNAPLTRYTHKFTIEQTTTVIFYTKKAQPFFDILDHLMLFQNFLTLGTFEPAFATSILLSNKNRKVGTVENFKTNEVKLYYSPGFHQSTNTKKSLWEFLFNYHDIATNFEDIIQKWFSQKDKIDPITNILFESFHQKKKFTVNNFLNIVQALETFHRRFRNNEIMTKAKHKQMISDIISTTNPDFQKWLHDRLNFSNEPTLHHRLVELISEISVKTLAKIIPNKDKIIKDTKNSRNFYTHYDVSLEKKALKGHELFQLTEKLRVLLIAIVLLETGFTMEQIEILFERNEFNFFNHITND